MTKRPSNDNQPDSVNDNERRRSVDKIANDNSGAGIRKVTDVAQAAANSMAAALAFAAFDVSGYRPSRADGEESDEERQHRELHEEMRAAAREAGLARSRAHNQRLKDKAMARRRDPDQMSMFEPERPIT